METKNQKSFLKRRYVLLKYNAVYRYYYFSEINYIENNSTQETSQLKYGDLENNP